MQNRFLQHLKTFPLYLLPNHLLSALLHQFMRIKCKKTKNTQINLFSKLYKVNMQEAERVSSEDYVDFNDFFTRKLKEDAREIIANDQQLLSPVDGVVSEKGKIKHDLLLQAKGQYYSLTELLAGDEKLCQTFFDGDFITIYLSPKDYHRIHMPITGKLKQMIHVPGDLFGVNPASVNTIPRLFARNERVINIFETQYGLMALIQVGAIFVSSIETVWHGVVTPPRQQHVQKWDYEEDITINQGEEMGRFNMGSTVILLFAKNKLELAQQCQANSSLQLGNVLGNLSNEQTSV